MKYEAKQAIYLPITDYLNLEFFLMDNRPGVKPGPFVVELVKRWLATETARLALRNGQAMRGFPVEKCLFAGRDNATNQPWRCRRIRQRRGRPHRFR